MSTLHEKLQEAAQFVRNNFNTKQWDAAIVLGSGQSDFVKSMREAHFVGYELVPHMPSVSITGHAGLLVSGMLGGSRILCFSGRIHPYEGSPYDQVCFQVLLSAMLCIPLYIITNTTGGMLDGMCDGSFMQIVDHVRVTIREDPMHYILPGVSREIVSYWDENLSELVASIAIEKNIKLFKGVYVWTSGPSYETPMEVEMMRKIGGGACGMSTVPEVLLAKQLGLPVVGLSIAANMAAGLSTTKLSHEDIESTARESMNQFTQLVSELVTRAKPIVQLQENPHYPHILESARNHIHNNYDLSKYMTHTYIATVANRLKDILVAKQFDSCIIAQSLEEEEELNLQPYASFRTYFPATSECAKYAMFKKLEIGSRNHLLLLAQGNGFSVEESSFLALLLYELGMERVLFIIPSKQLQDRDIVPVRDLLNFSASTRPLSYLFTMVENNNLVPLHKEVKAGTNYMSFQGPSTLSKSEQKMARVFEAKFYGTYSILPFFAIRYMGIPVRPVLANHLTTSFLVDTWQPILPSLRRTDVKVKWGNFSPLAQHASQKIKYEKIEEAAQFVRKIFHQNPEYALFSLDLPMDVHVIQSIPISEIPHATECFWREDVHLQLIQLKSGVLCWFCPKIAEITHPHYLHNNGFIIRLFQNLQVTQLFLFSSFMSTEGSSIPLEHLSLCMVKDHVNFTGENPLTGPNEHRWGVRFPDMSEVYSHEMINLVSKHAPHVNRVNLLFHGNMNHREYSQLERGTVARICGAQVMSSLGAVQAILARHYNPSVESFQLSYFGVVLDNPNEKQQVLSQSTGQLLDLVDLCLR